MAFPFSRALPILRGVSELSGVDLHDVEGEELATWVAERDEQWSYVGFDNAMRRLKSEGYLSCYFDHSTTDAPGSTVHMIRLLHPGREVAENWPSSGKLDPATVSAAITAALDAAADDEQLPEDERGALRKIGEGAANTVLQTAITAAMARLGIG